MNILSTVNRVLVDPKFAAQLKSDADNVVANFEDDAAWQQLFAHFAANPEELTALAQLTTVRGRTRLSDQIVLDEFGTTTTTTTITTTTTVGCTITTTTTTTTTAAEMLPE